MNAKKNANSYANGLNLEYSIVRPGGNDTCLIHNIVEQQSIRKEISETIMQNHPNVEQVAFIETNPDRAEILMAGGEFCGNATRSAAWKILNQQPNSNLKIKASGVSEAFLDCGVDENNNAWSKMPIKPETSNIETIDQKTHLVHLDGISHMVIHSPELENKIINEEQIKSEAMTLLTKHNLQTLPAAGVIHYYNENGTLKIHPVVYVSSIDTLFYESGCGSGTTALAMVKAIQENSSQTNLEVIQPSQMPIIVNVEFNNNEFKSAKISGPVELLTKGRLIKTSNSTYTIEQVQNQQQLNAYLQNGLCQTYQEAFSQAPYFEYFSDSDVKEIFESYLKTGISFVAVDKGQVIGFSAATPIDANPGVLDAVRNSITKSNVWYMADLGVKSDYRRQGIANELVKIRIDSIPNNAQIIMRTSVDNHASQNIYKALGFTRIQNAIQNVEQARQNQSVQSDIRLFMTKDKNANS